MKKLIGLALCLALAPLAVADLVEGFEDITTLPGAGWVETNLSSPIGTIGYFQGNPDVFTAYEGAGYLGVNYNSGSSVANISNWMMTPAMTLTNGATVSFFTRTGTSSSWPDRLEIRMSTNGTSSNVGTTWSSVGDFTTLLLSVNPNLTVGGYPEVWTQYAATISGLAAPVQGRLAFRYFVTNGGPSGANSNYIGIDSFSYVVPEPASLVLLALGALALRRR